MVPPGNERLVPLELVEEGGGDLLLADLHPLRHRDLQHAGLGLNVPDVDPALVVEEDDVLVPGGVHAHVGLLLLGVRQERLNDEFTQFTRRLTDLNSHLINN